jgi:hypothetical protein
MSIQHSFSAFVRWTAFLIVFESIALCRSPYYDNSVSISHAASLDATYEAVLTEIKKEGFSIDSASKDAGVKTALTVSGHYRQAGSHLEIQFIQDAATQTSVHVAVLVQTRYKALKTEPWSSPKIDTEQSQQTAAKLKAGLGW